MNYLRGSITAAYQYYRDLPPINASTLTGAIDVIVIQRKDENGEILLACTPFHVRFGKWQILRPSEKKVNVQVNGHPIPFNMKIGEAGEAFFVFETEEDVPEDLITSPILQATTPLQATASGTQEQGDRFGAKVEGTPLDELDTRDAVNRTEEQNEKMDDQNAIPEPDFLDLDATDGPKDRDRSGSGETVAEPGPLAPLEPASLEEYIVEPPSKPRRSSSIDGLEKRPVQEGKRVGEPREEFTATAQKTSHHFGKAHSDEETIGHTARHGEEVPRKHERQDPSPPVAYLEDVVVDMAGYHSKDASDRTVTDLKEAENRLPFEADIPTSVAENAQALLIDQRQHLKESLADTTIDVTVDTTTNETTPTSSRAHSPTLSSTTPATSASAPRPVRATSEPPDLDLSQVSSQSSLNDSGPRYSWGWGSFPVQTPSKSTFSHEPSVELDRTASIPPLVEHAHTPEDGDELKSSGSMPVSNQPQGEEEDDFDINFGRGARLTSAGEFGFNLEFKGKVTRFELSLCGDVSAKSRDGMEAAFRRDQVSFQRFIEKPEIVHKDELCVLWKGRFLSRKQSSPILPALVVWRQATLGSSIVQSDEEPLSSADERDDREQEVEQRPPPAKPSSTAGRWSRWFGRGRGTRDTNSGASTPASGPHTPAAVQSVNAPILETPPLVKVGPTEKIGTNGVSQQNGTSGPANPTKHTHYVKTLRLTSDQLKQLSLKKGPNSITFSISATGAATCTARIFVWDATDQIVVSDIDGTITKSDALGHVFTMIGRDWTHSGVAKLYTDICRNGYKIMYLTSRAIGQADSTRDYLRGINQNNYQLPEGPVIMSPDRLMASLHREVIMRQPEVFKMACLRDIQRLFGPVHRNPFYAGFGNRITDALSYRSVNVPSGRIFTIDSSGEVKMELLELAGYKSSYIHMTDLVDQMFPPIHRKWAPEFTDANFWRQPIEDFDFPEFRPVSPQPTSTPSPPSPALSARSDASMQTGLSRLRNFSLRGGRTAPATEFIPAGTTTTSKGNGSVDAGYRAHQRAKSSFGQGRVPKSTTHSRHTSDEGIEGVAIPQGKRGTDERKAEHRLSSGSMPGSYDGFRLDEEYEEEDEEDEYEESDEDYEEEDGDAEEDDMDVHAEDEHEEFDDLLATGAMDSIPYI